MSLSDTSVRRPVTILVIAVLIVAVGLFIVGDIAVAMFPSVDPPFIVVRTTYIGASPIEVEQSVTERLEQQLSSISGLQSITSTSSAGTSTIMLEFGYDRDMDEATNDIRDALEIVRDMLPDGAGSPAIRKFDMSSQAIMRLIMNGDESPDTLKRLAEDVVRPRLERLEGVASADVSGGETRVVRVDLSLNRLAAYNLTAGQITSALSSQNVQMSGGTMEVATLEYNLRVDERFSSLEDIRRTVVATVNAPSAGGQSINRSRVIRLEDVADVYEGTADRSSLVYVNGRPSIQIQIRNESDTNVVQVAQAVRNALPDLNSGLPRGVTVSVLYDNTTYIGSVLNTVYKAALQGILLAMAILFLFLRNWRTTVIIGLSIPVSLLVTLMFMFFFNITLNMISLTGLILGLGMIVDNSIVILENIYKYRERGAKLKVSAILGSREMLTAIVASTLTTLSVFIPMIIWKDDLAMIGEVFSDLIFTVVIALSVSLLVAVTIVPALSANYIGIYTATQGESNISLFRRLNRLGEIVLQALENGYTRALSFALGNRAVVLSLVVTILAATAAHFTTMGINLMPTGDSDDTVRIDLTMPVGTTLEETERVLLRMTDIVEAEVQGYENLIVNVGGGGGGGGPQGGAGASGSIEISLPQPADQIITPQEIQSILRPHTTSFPKGEFTFSSGRGFGSGSPVDIVVASDNLDLASDTAARIRDLLVDVPGILDPVTDLDDGSPEYRIVLDRDRTAAYGLDVTTIGRTIDGLIDGNTPTTWWDNATELDVIVRLAEEDRADLPELSSIFIMSARDERVALSSFASYTTGTGPKDINRENQTRIVHVTADLAPGTAATEITPVLESLLATELVVPDGVSVSVGGDTDEISNLVGPLMTVMAVAVLMIFAVMASQFESLVDPFIIFFSIPLLFVGVVGIYVITGEAFSLFSVIGMIVLSGIVVNNGIVLVHYTNLLRKRGTPLRQAVLEAAHSRLRPVLMTSLTTILGMIPLGFLAGEGTEMIAPIGQTIVGGLAASTAITLFVTPVVYSLVNRDRRINV